MTHPEIIKQTKEVIGQYLLGIIKERGLTMEGISEQAGISKRITYNIVQGKGYTIDSLLALLGALKMHVDISESLVDPEQSN